MPSAGSDADRSISHRPSPPCPDVLSGMPVNPATGSLVSSAGSEFGPAVRLMIVKSQDTNPVRRTNRVLLYRMSLSCVRSPNAPQQLLSLPPMHAPHRLY